MGLKYKIGFKTITDKNCEVLLDEKNYTGSVIELTAGGTPLQIEVGTDDLYLPMRTSTATLSVYGSDYLQDLYTSDPFGVKVTVKINGNIHWLGYLTPDAFSQDFSRPEFIYDMECVSALSVLKHKEFDVESGFISFLDIIKTARDYAGYDMLYLTNSIRSSTGSFYDLKIAAANFWDELGEPMTYYEVLEEIAKYAGCTFVPYKGDLYLLDYKAIRMGFNLYERWGSYTKSMVTLSAADSVTQYKGTGTNMSRIAGKNKATVNCSLYEIKDLLPSFDDEGSTVWMSSMLIQEYEETIKVGKDNQTWKGIVRYYRQPKFTFYHYPTQGGVVESDSPPLAIRGSGFVRTTEFEKDKTPVRLSMTDEVQVKLFDTGNNTQYLNGKKIITLKSEKEILFHKDIWFCLNYQFKLSDKIWTKKESDLKITKDFTSYIPAQFRIGKYYYNGTAWTEFESTFNVPISYKKGDKIIGEYKNINNTNTYDKGLGDLNGFIFKAPGFAVAGDCELTLYTPSDIELGGVIQGYPPLVPGAQYMYIKDISFAHGAPDQDSVYDDYMSRDDKSDAVYENEVGEYIDKADEIDLRICTSIDKKLALSSVIQGGDFVANIETDVYGVDVAEHILIKRMVGLFSNPRIVIDPILASGAEPYTVYTEPHLSKQFVVAGGEEDVRMESTKYNLIEI